MKDRFEQAVQGRAHEYAVISTGDLNFSVAIVKMCEVNTCGNYNRSWSCPPAIGTLEDLKKRITAFQKAFVFTTKQDLEDSFDYEGMMAAKANHDKLTRELHEKFGKTNPVFGAGGCKLCESCAFPEPCRFPDKIYSSIEAAGINVTELSRTAGIKYNNGANTITYFSMILFNE
jgi:predicted metal-binding protein